MVVFGRILRGLDIPPGWLALCAGAAWGLDRLFPGLGLGIDWMRLMGDGLIGLGLGAMGLALWEFLRARTSFLPRRVPSSFIRRGIYRITRNPIYLGDALVLGGLILRWDVLAALPLVPLFMALITRRFILSEEAGLIAEFGDDFRNWAARVRRWI